LRPAFGRYLPSLRPPNFYLYGGIESLCEVCRERVYGGGLFGTSHVNGNSSVFHRYAG
jgi:hypothetical protein